jgi:hypothetical protein
MSDFVNPEDRNKQKQSANKARRKDRRAYTKDNRPCSVCQQYRQLRRWNGVMMCANCVIKTEADLKPAKSQGRQRAARTKRTSGASRVPFTRASEVVVKSMATGDILRTEKPYSREKAREVVLNGQHFPSVESKNGWYR